VSSIRLALAFLVSPLVFVAAYWLILMGFWGGPGGYAYEGVGALMVGYPIGFLGVLVGGLPLLFQRLPSWLELSGFVLAGLISGLLWSVATSGRLGGSSFQFFELCAVSAGVTYPAFVRLAALRRAS
jgi:hypothetical protein